MHEATHGTDCAQLVGSLAAQTDGIPADAPCCAWCGNIELDVTIEPEPPAKMLKRGKGCAISIVAYTAARDHMKGRKVEITPQANRVPLLTVDGESVDPLSHYNDAACGCPGIEAE